MKPVKNRVLCKECGRTKMLFESEKKALNFIKFNSEEIKESKGRAPVRAYFCEFCGGWHVTSRPNPKAYLRSKTERVIEMFHQVTAVKS